MFPTNSSIALIGYGEVGGIFARELQARGAATIRAFDIKFAPGTAAGDGAAEFCHAAADAIPGAGLVFSAVTAAETLTAARAAAPHIGQGAFYVDLNSASPGMKREAAALINGAGGRYVEAAVMASVPPYKLKVPMLLGGPHAGDFLAFAAPLELDARIYDSDYGRASAVKLCRSVLTKGIEALLTESMMAARHYGVEADVLASLADMLPLPDWNKTARYMISRSVLHGRRRAEEMREAARMVAEAGIAPLMSERIADRQASTFAKARAGGVQADAALVELADGLLAAERMA